MNRTNDATQASGEGKAVILYARVSTREQAVHGYSINAQLAELRSFSEKSGYWILEEVKDEGVSGASLARPGIDRIRDRVEEFDVAFVLVQDRDRISRRTGDAMLLRQELRRYGCELRSIKDRATGHPEDDLMDHIIDSLAEFERNKLQERSRRGKERKAREGKILRSWKAPYGFEYDSDGDHLQVNEEEAKVVSDIFRLTSEGHGNPHIQDYLYKQGIRSPAGRMKWNRPTIKDILANDLYRPHTVSEIAPLVIPEVLSGLKPNSTYGLWKYYQYTVSQETEVEEDDSGRREYRQKTYRKRNPEEDLISVPVPAFLDRDVVDMARAVVRANSGRKFGIRTTRDYPLKGILRCSCGTIMSTKVVLGRKRKDGTLKRFHYYYCAYKTDNYLNIRCEQKMFSAKRIEDSVEEFVIEVLKEPARLQAGVGRYLESETRSDTEQLTYDLKTLSRELEEIDAFRRNAQRLAVEGLMTTSELAEQLRQLEERRELIGEEAKRASERLKRLEGLDGEKNRILEELKTLAAVNLDSLTPQEVRTVYALIGLVIQIEEDRTLRLRGSICHKESSCSSISLTISPTSSPTSESS